MSQSEKLVIFNWILFASKHLDIHDFLFGSSRLRRIIKDRLHLIQMRRGCYHHCEMSAFIWNFLRKGACLAHYLPSLNDLACACCVFFSCSSDNDTSYYLYSYITDKEIMPFDWSWLHFNEIFICIQDKSGWSFAEGAVAEDSCSIRKGDGGRKEVQASGFSEYISHVTYNEFISVFSFIVFFAPCWSCFI